MPSPKRKRSDRGSAGGLGSAGRRGPAAKDPAEKPIPGRYRDVLQERLEDALRYGRLRLSFAQYLDLLWALYPEDFEDLPEDVEATDAAPGSPERVDVYRGRAALPRALFRAGDNAELPTRSGVDLGRELRLLPGGE